MTDKDSHALQQLIENLVDEQQRHKVPYATEGGQFTNAGIPTVICGPGDIGTAHKANEFVGLKPTSKMRKLYSKFFNNAVTAIKVSGNIMSNQLTIQLLPKLPQSQFAKRRAKLAEALPNNSIAILQTAPAHIRNNDAEYKYRADSSFLPDWLCWARIRHGFAL